MIERKEILGYTIEEWIEKKCATQGCYNHAQGGIIYCNDCYYDRPQKLPEEVIKEMKKLKDKL